MRLNSQEAHNRSDNLRHPIGVIFGSFKISWRYDTSGLNITQRFDYLDNYRTNMFTAAYLSCLKALYEASASCQYCIDSSTWI